MIRMLFTPRWLNPFILGVIYDQTTVNLQRPKQPLVLVVPEPKLWILEKLKDTVGGTIKQDSKGLWHYELHSKDSKALLGKWLKPLLKSYPELKPLYLFLNGAECLQPLQRLNSFSRLKRDIKKLPPLKNSDEFDSEAIEE